MVRRKAPTIKDVAARAGVSKSAVSRALLGQGEVSPETRERIEEAAEELGYLANAMAAGLRSSTRTIGVVLRDVNRPYYGALYAALQAQAEERGYRLVTATSARELDVTAAIGALRSLVSLQVDGLIIASAQLPSEQLVPFVDRVPIVVAGRMELRTAVPGAYCDDGHGGAVLAEHLLDRGHTRIAVGLVQAEYSLSQHLRGRAMIDRIQSGGCEPVVIPVDDDRAMRSVVGDVLADPTITAFMCPTDTSMVDVMDELRIRGEDVPRSLSLTGYDGIGPLAAPLLGLTTFRQPMEEIGAVAVDLLVDAIEGRAPEPGREHVAIRGTLIAGRTVADVGVSEPAD